MLDADNMVGFIDTLQIIKEFFNRVILISHLENLKDSIDSLLEVETEDGIASVINI